MIAARVLAVPARAGGVTLRLLLDLILPPRCPGCGGVVQAPHRFCLPCWSTLDFLAGPHCPRCGDRLEVPAAPGTVCGGCLAEPPAFDRVCAAVAYGDVARTVALKLKHGNRPMLAATIARMLLRPAEGLPADALLVPVPLARWRLWRRGYNQAALIAGALSRLTGRPIDLHLLDRHRATPVLRGLGRQARVRAVDGAFRMRRRAALGGRAVVLVDDVLTSGATATACARILKRGGAGRVDVLCWARVLEDDAAS